MTSLSFWTMRVFRGRSPSCWSLSILQSRRHDWSHCCSHNRWWDGSASRRSILSEFIWLWRARCYPRVQDSRCGHSPVWRGKADLRDDYKGAEEGGQTDPPHHWQDDVRVVRWVKPSLGPSILNNLFWMCFQLIPI